MILTSFFFADYIISITSNKLLPAHFILKAVRFISNFSKNKITRFSAGLFIIDF